MIRWLAIGVIVSMILALCSCELLTPEEKAEINAQIAAMPPAEKSSLASAVEEKIKDELSSTASEINSLTESITSSLSSAADAIGEDALSSTPDDIYPFEDDSNIPDLDWYIPESSYDIQGEGDTGGENDIWETPEFSTSSK